MCGKHNSAKGKHQDRRLQAIGCTVGYAKITPKRMICPASAMALAGSEKGTKGWLARWHCDLDLVQHQPDTVPN